MMGHVLYPPALLLNGLVHKVRTPATAWGACNMLQQVLLPFTSSFGSILAPALFKHHSASHTCTQQGSTSWPQQRCAAGGWHTPTQSHCLHAASNIRSNRTTPLGSGTAPRTQFFVGPLHYQHHSHPHHHHQWPFKRIWSSQTHAQSTHSTKHQSSKAQGKSPISSSAPHSCKEKPSGVSFADKLQGLTPVSEETIIRGGQLYPFRLRRYRLPVTIGAQQSTLKLDDDPHLKWALDIVDRLRKAGHSAYFAGGWVRDALLGTPATDIDIATSANVYQELPLILSTHTVRQLMRSTARVEQGGMQLEVTQLRGPRKEADMESLALDACLRDFTINSLYYDTQSHEVLDFLQGIEHLQKQCLELPPNPMVQGLPSTVIKEDPIRVLRAIRFAAKYQLSLSPALTMEVRACAPRCRFEAAQGSGTGIGNRRLFKELSKVCNLGQVDPPALSKAFKMMSELNVLHALAPDLVVPEPGVCERLQEALTQAAGNIKPGGVSAWAAEARLLMLVNPTEGEESQRTLAAMNEFMTWCMRDAWVKEVVDLFMEAGRLSELHSELYREMAPHEQIPIGSDGRPDSLAIFKARMNMDGSLPWWQKIMTSKNYPLLLAWLLAWQPDDHRQVMKEEMASLAQYVTKTYP